MAVLLHVLLVILLLGLSTLIGAFFVQRKQSEGLTNLWLWGVLVQAVTGLAMVGLIDGARIDGGLSTAGHIKIGIKLVVLVVIGLLALIGRNRPAQARPLAPAMAALTVVNLALAVLWST